MEDDPELFTKVSAKHKLIPARFMGQEEGRIILMVKDYLAEQEDLRSAAAASSSSR